MWNKVKATFYNISKEFLSKKVWRLSAKNDGSEDWKVARDLIRMLGAETALWKEKFSLHFEKVFVGGDVCV